MTVPGVTRLVTTQTTHSLMVAYPPHKLYLYTDDDRALPQALSRPPSTMHLK